MKQYTSFRGAQDGATLIIVLMLLLLVTILGLAVMRDSIMQERMAGYTVARGYAFQAAEAAMREAEEVARGKPAIPGTGCENGVCARPAVGGVPTYEAPGFWTTAGNFRTAATSENGIAPRYSIEDYGLRRVGDDEDGECLGSNCGPAAAGMLQVYRITVLSAAPGGTEVMLQSLFQTQ